MSRSLSDRLRAAFGTSLQPTGGPSRAPVAGRVASAPEAPADEAGSPAGAAGPSDREPGVPGGGLGPGGRFPTAERLVTGGSQLPAGRLYETGEGPCWLAEVRYPLQHRHGDYRLDAWLELPRRGLGCLVKDAALPSIDPREVVFLDTETTGLAGGTGTTPFLIGLAFLEQADPGCWPAAPTAGAGGSASTPLTLVVRQLFMRDFGEERAVLAALDGLLEPFRYVVTFNGKSFDLPLIETRYVLARLPWRWRPARHFDLLHPARRLWRQRLDSCSLVSLEQALLGHCRELDVPSRAIPSIYAAYLRHGEVQPLGRVFEHNRQDLLSLATLLSLLSRRLAEPLGAGLEADELLAVGRLYAELGLRDEACACLEVAAAGAAGPNRQRALLQLALAARSAGRYQRALELWQELAVGQTAPLALVELAKHHEHRRGDVATAQALVEEALALLDLREARDGPHRWRRDRLELEQRLARLARKRQAGRRPASPAGSP